MLTYNINEMLFLHSDREQIGQIIGINKCDVIDRKYLPTQSGAPLNIVLLQEIMQLEVALNKHC